MLNRIISICHICENTSEMLTRIIMGDVPLTKFEYFKLKLIIYFSNIKHLNSYLLKLKNKYKKG